MKKIDIVTAIYVHTIVSSRQDYKKHLAETIDDAEGHGTEDSVAFLATLHGKVRETLKGIFVDNK